MKKRTKMRVSTRGRALSAFAAGAALLIALASCDPTSLLADIEAEANGTKKSGTVAAPQFGITTGTYSSDQSVTITCSTDGATIHYTTDTTTPSGSSAEYSAAVAVAGNGTVMRIRAFAAKSGMYDSDVAEVTITINYSQVSTPQITPDTGNYTSTQSVTITCGTTGSTIRYTTDGNDPTSTTGTIYTGAISVKNSLTLKAIAYQSGWTDSTVSSATYTITRYVYTANLGETVVSVSAFTIGSGGALSSNSSTDTGYDQPRAITISPNGKYLYVGHSTGRAIRAYTIGSNGALSLNSTETLSTDLVTLRISPDGSHLYAVCVGASISVYDIASDGKLSWNSSAAVSGVVATGMVITRDGKYLYVTVTTGVSSAGSLQGYTIAADGSLTANGNVATGYSPAAVEVSMDSKYLYVSNSGTSANTVSWYTIGTTGAPTYSNSVSTSTPGGMVAGLNGSYLFVVNQGANTVSSFTIGAGGALASTGYTGATGSAPRMIVISADGKYLYVTNYYGPSVSIFTIGSGGSFTAGTAVSTGTNPWELAISP